MKIWTAMLAIIIGFGASGWAIDLIRAGQPASTIIIPEQATALENEAAQKLADYLAMAAGAKIPIVKENEKTAGTAISIGKTKLAAEAGISDKNLKYDGYILQVKGNTLFLLGRDGKIIDDKTIKTQGSIRAVLAFLEQVGFRWLQPTPKGLYVPKMKDVSVPNTLNIVYEPPFASLTGRMTGWGDWSLANSYRKAIAIYSAGGHTWNLAVPKSLWEKHPEYFRMQGGMRIEPVDPQVCASNPDVVKLITQFTINKFEQGYELVALGQPDAFKACECDVCKQFAPEDQVHNTQRRVIQACYEKYPDRFAHLLAYGPTTKPPTLFTNYPPNTMVEVCLTGGMAKQYGSHEKALEFWKSLIPGGSTVYVYYMGLYQNVGMGAKFTPQKAAEQITMLLRQGVKGIYFCGGGENWGAEGPVYYIIGRLATNPNQEWRKLLDEYCTLTFGKAAGKTMRQYYELLYGRIDSYYASHLGGADVFTAMFTPEVLDRLHNLLTLARKQAEGDARAFGWIETAEIAYRHYSGIAKAYHLYQAYQFSPTKDNLANLGQAVRDYLFFCSDLKERSKKDKTFFKDYFPAVGLWVAESNHGALTDNMNKIASPFTWDFEKLKKTGFLPGKTRAKLVVPKLASAPDIDGELNDKAWESAPWIDVREVSLGETEATTRMRLGYDSNNLYVAFECSEPRIDEMKVIEMGRDGKVFTTECVEMFLAPDGFGQQRMQFILSPTAAGIWDGRYGYIDDPEHPLVLTDRADTSWNPNYKHAFKIDAGQKKWTIEIMLPFSELETGVPDDGVRWRGNFGRERHKHVWDKVKYPHKHRSELYLWSPNLQGATFTDPAAFGDIYFGSSPDEKSK